MFGIYSKKVVLAKLLLIVTACGGGHSKDEVNEESLEKKISSTYESYISSGRENKNSFFLSETNSCDQIAKAYKNELMSNLYTDYIWALERLYHENHGDIIYQEGTVSNTSHTKTNTQVEGVDESDYVKTDGQYIYQVGIDGNLRVFSKDMTTQKTLEVTSNRDEILNEIYLDQKVVTILSSDSSIYTVDLKDFENPNIKKLNQFKGKLRSSRKVGDMLYLILTKDLPANSKVPVIYNSSAVATKGNILQKFRKDIKKIKALKTDELFTWTDQESKEYCSNAFVSEYSDASSITTVKSIDLSTKEVNSASVFSGNEHIYANSEAIYLTERSSKYYRGPWRMSADSTVLHKFAIDSKKVDYVGSIELDGRVLNQFSMDEKDGVMRLAIENFPENSVVTIAESEDVTDSKELVILGQTETLAHGENIYSVRFIDDTAYVVTFVRIDPLFTINLTDPKSPKVVGELKVPGFSTYLHPISDERLLAVGEQNGRMKVSLFHAPKDTDAVELDSYVMSGTRAKTFSHKSFTYSARDNKLVIPVGSLSGRGEDNYKVIDVGADSLSEAATLGIEKCYDGFRSYRASPILDGWDSWNTAIELEPRSLFIDDRLYLINGHQLKSQGVEELGTGFTNSITFKNCRSSL